MKKNQFSLSFRDLIFFSRFCITLEVFKLVSLIGARRGFCYAIRVGISLKLLLLVRVTFRPKLNFLSMCSFCCYFRVDVEKPE